MFTLEDSRDLKISHVWFPKPFLKFMIIVQHLLLENPTRLVKICHAIASLSI